MYTTKTRFCNILKLYTLGELLKILLQRVCSKKRNLTESLNPKRVRGEETDVVYKNVVLIASDWHSKINET